MRILLWGSEGVNRGDKIEGLSNEDTTDDEGTIRYDIRFSAAVPNKEEVVQLIINVEAQLKGTGLGYALGHRIVYYLSRLISAQNGPIFKNEEYDKIHKVYSIWIVSKQAVDNQNSVVQYSMAPKCIYGSPKDRHEEFDLMTAIIVNLKPGDDTVDNDILKLMNVLLAKDIPVKEKEDLMECEYNIPMTEEFTEEVGKMCNLSQGIVDDTLDQVIDTMIKANFTDEQIKTATSKDITYIDGRRKALKYEEKNFVKV